MNACPYQYICKNFPPAWNFDSPGCDRYFSDFMNCHKFHSRVIHIRWEIRDNTHWYDLDYHGISFHIAIML